MLYIFQEAIEKTLSKTKNTFALKVKKLLESLQSNEIVQDTKERANSISTKAEISKQTKWVNDSLKDRQNAIDAELIASNEIWKEKDAFRQKMYQATSQLSNKEELTQDKTK